MNVKKTLLCIYDVVKCSCSDWYRLLAALLRTILESTYESFMWQIVGTSCYNPFSSEFFHEGELHMFPNSVISSVALGLSCG